MRSLCWLVACLIVLSISFLDRPAQSSEKKNSTKCVLKDEGTRDKSFCIFRNRLEDAIKKRDRKFVGLILSPEIETALGGAKGKQAFIQQWKLSSATSPFWQRMS